MEWLCLDFMNSEWRDWRGSGQVTERLEDDAWIGRFLDKWRLPIPLPLHAEERLRLIELRDRMRAMLETVVSGQPLTGEQLAYLNEAIGRANYTYRAVGEGDGNSLRLERASLAAGWDRAIGEIALSWGEVLASDETSRLRICDNPACRWAFHDASRNRSKRWCDDKCCGNLMKVRRFRARHNEGQSASSTKTDK